MPPSSQPVYKLTLPNSTKLQNAQWARLDALNKKREAIEAQILSSMKAIELQTINISSELAATYGGRIEEIEDGASPRS